MSSTSFRSILIFASCVVGTYLHGPTDYAKKLKLKFRVRDLDLPQRRKTYTSSREEEGVVTHMRPCGTTIE